MPKYLQVKSALSRWIEGFEQGEALPSEVELAKVFGVSRVTMRKAQSELVMEGKLDRAQGRVTRMAQAKVSLRVGLVSHAEALREEGRSVVRTVLDHGLAAADREVAAALAVPAASEVLAVRRLVTVDGVPLALYTDYLPTALFPVLPSVEQLGGSLTVWMAGAGVAVAGFRQRVETAPMSHDATQLLDVPASTAALVVHHVAYDGEGRNVLHARSVYRGDRVELSYEITASNT
ncbi:GntR family transcriptional regulator [Nonomuraea sp. NPDC050556]|uniref:GntR family transcriptional regulator n=1 Tax=Nonomuraea sp. NPDC050556 TaxID=3364369 RepID=UPI0037A2254A